MKPSEFLVPEPDYIREARERARPKLCARTLALYLPGHELPGVTCSFRYTGSVPCTGPIRCTMCGREKPEV